MNKSCNEKETGSSTIDLEGQKSNCRLFYLLNLRTSFWVRVGLIVLLLSAPPIFIFRCIGDDWFKSIFGSGIYFTGCLGLLSFLLKNYWDGNRKRYNALCILESELLLQISTFQENIDKMETVIGSGIPFFATPTFVEPDLKILNNLGRIEIKGDAFNLLSRVADLKASIDFYSRVSLEQIGNFKNPDVLAAAMDRLKTNKQCVEKFRDELKALDIRVIFFIKNDRPFWSIPVPFFSKREYEKFLHEEPSRIQQYLAEKNKDREGPTYL